MLITFCRRYAVFLHFCNVDQLYSPSGRQISNTSCFGIYVCPAWHTGLNEEQTKQIEVIQKRALRIIFNSNGFDYKFFCQIHDLQTLADRRSDLCKSFFNKNVLEEASWRVEGLVWYGILEFNVPLNTV